MSRIKQAAALLCAVILLCSSCGREQHALVDASLMEPEQANYGTVQVQQGEYIKQTKGAASTVYLVWANLAWQKENARMEEVLVRPGAEVKKGEVLATFRVEASEADIKEKELQLKRLKESYQEEKVKKEKEVQEAQVASEGLSSRQRRIAELKAEQVLAAYEQYLYQKTKEISALEQALAEQKEEDAQNRLVAPFDGIIDKVESYHSGDKVEAGKTIITMYSPDKLLLSVDTENSGLRYNMEVTVETGPKDERVSCKGRVVAASNVLPLGVTGGKAMIALEEKLPAKILNYSTEYTGIIEQAQSALTVDKKAISMEEGKSFVYILENDTVKKRYISAGSDNGTVAWILDGLSEGQTLIID